MNTIERNKDLVKRWPFLVFKINYWTGEPIPEEELDYKSTWWDEIPVGWAKAFGEQMCDELLEILKKADYVDEYKIIQIKEKFGMLRWYDNGVPNSIWEEYEDWLDKYEVMSEKTCIVCGAPATHMTTGWIMPVCDSCFEEIENR